MTDREKLIKLLDMNCGYVAEMTATDLADYMISHGVAVKEPQKPIRKGHLLENSPCWFEVRYDDGHVELEPVEITKGTGANYYIYVIGSETGTKLDGLEYGKWWRCWAEKPTEVERMAAEWEK